MIELIASFIISAPCTNQQPYADSPWEMCTGYGLGQTCNIRICAYPPGTPGQWGNDGRYTPKIG